jgi:AraC-like DNA-binding protein
MDSRIQMIVSGVKTNPHQELSLVEAAQWVNLSPSRLRHLFKSELGMSPTQFHRAVRMEGARLLLETSFMRVKEIMRSVGIKDESHFVRDFKRTYGQTPCQYRSCRLRGVNKEFKSVGGPAS